MSGTCPDDDPSLVVSAGGLLELVPRPASLVIAFVDLADRMDRAEQRAAGADASRCAYDDALANYAQLVRHRLANPIQTVLGMSRTLLDMPELDDLTRLRMVEAIHDQALVLRSVCLEPRRLSDVEHELDPRPRLSPVRSRS